MSQPKFVDCQGLAGAWSLGTFQAGFELAHRVSLPGGFGDNVVLHNRHLLGDGHWEIESGDPHDVWTSQADVSLLCGTPPCSGFSLLNKSKKENARGPNSNINNCMKELISYAGRCTGTDGRPGPEIVSFESVQGAYSQGRVLMQALREKLEWDTGQRYALTHVLMSGAAIGAAQFRHRYFPVFHRIPFGVDTPEQKHITTYEDAIGDLEGLDLTWDLQPYVGFPHTDLSKISAFAQARRSPSGFVGDHMPEERERDIALFHEIFDAGWPEGYNLPGACIYSGIRPEAMERHWNEEKQEYMGWRWPARINRRRCGWVLTGAAAGEYLHYSQRRLLTVRECSRLMGYPDDWRWPTDRPGTAGGWIGKCCPVDSGRWISEWFLRSLNGEPGKDVVEMDDGENEFYHNSTLVYRKWPGGNVPPREKKA